MVYSGIMTGIIICVLAYSCWMDIRQREIPIELYLLVILPMGIIAFDHGNRDQGFLRQLAWQ